MLTCGHSASNNIAPWHVAGTLVTKDFALMLDGLSLEDFLPLVGTEVAVSAFGHDTRMTLREAAAIKSPSPRALPPFHLVLGAPPTWRTPQGMFRFTHPKLGDIEMFAVPIGPDGDGFCYEIVFN